MRAKPSYIPCYPVRGTAGTYPRVCNLYCVLCAVYGMPHCISIHPFLHPSIHSFIHHYLDAARVRNCLSHNNIDHTGNIKTKHKQAQPTQHQSSHAMASQDLPSLPASQSEGNGIC